ncbi:class I SAM-dependent methyltransferase [bacterium]|nr:class I SAM-dependent methyltransferase [bacterium]
MRAVRHARALIYDTAIVGLTAGWYRAVLERLPVGCRLLDIGIGTGSALLANAALLTGKRIHVTGLDIDGDYIERCRRAVAQRGLLASIEPRLESVYDHRGGPYDAAYFSASFMLLPDPPAALRHVRSRLAPGARIYFTQTFEHAPSRAVETLKPLLRLLTTIDFGRVTYEADFRRALAAGGEAVETFEPLNQGPRRSGVLAISRQAA